MVQIKTRNNGEINIRVLLIQISNRMLCHMPQEFAPFCFFLRCKEHVPHTSYGSQRIDGPDAPKTEAEFKTRAQRTRRDSLQQSPGPRLLRDRRRPALIFFILVPAITVLPLRAINKAASSHVARFCPGRRGEAASQVGPMGLVAAAGSCDASCH